MTTNQEKLEVVYRYGMPLQWVLDKLKDKNYSLITEFDIKNAQHELDTLINTKNKKG